MAESEFWHVETPCEECGIRDCSMCPHTDGHISEEEFWGE